MPKFNLLYFLLLMLACKGKQQPINPVVSAITESVYVSGVVKSEAQYQAFANVNGTIQRIYLQEGAAVKKGTPILVITNDLQQLNTQNAQLAAQYASISNNQGKIEDAKNLIVIQKRKMDNDSLLWVRQQNIWQNNGGTKVELEQRQLGFESAKVDYQSALLQFDELNRQLAFADSQARKNLQISQKMASDFILKSEVDGVLYQLYKKEGEAVTSQTPLALLGGKSKFILEMQVDEYDIFKVKPGQLVLVNFDSYKGRVFQAKVSSISPMMNEATKTFLVEAVFTDAPQRLYPFISFEANIVIQSKTKGLLIPISYLLNDSTVLKSNGKMVRVRTGLKDYKMVEILDGLSVDDELQIPMP
jgi:HlyD family secretion protein